MQAEQEYKQSRSTSRAGVQVEQEYKSSRSTSRDTKTHISYKKNVEGGGIYSERTKNPDYNALGGVNVHMWEKTQLEF